MKPINMVLKNKKKERLKINNINDFKIALKQDGYTLNEFNEENFKEAVAKEFQVDSNVVDRLHKSIHNTDITYRANDIKDFIDYIEKIILFENEHKRLWEKISGVKKLNIHRIEYEREPRIQENVEDIINIIEKLKNDISTVINDEDNLKLKSMEKEIDRNHLYAKDIELLKKMLLANIEDVEEKYNAKTQIKTISIKMPENINYHYIPAQRGTVEFHEHLNKNIPRIQRLIKNIDKYMEPGENATFKIDQSKTLQGSINIALAFYDNKEFKAISGNNDIPNYCKLSPKGTEVFKSNKVNKLGKLGIGYDRFNDSEKKIFEEIHKQIEAKVLKNEGNLILYTKWEPCPSCYFVISQFCKKHPDIKVQVKYGTRYGEL